MIWLNSIRNELDSIFLEINKNVKVNRLLFIYKDKKPEKFEKSWDQTVQDEFEQYLPKSKKGKIRAWYLPEIEVEKEYLKELTEEIKINLSEKNPDWNNALCSIIAGSGSSGSYSWEQNLTLKNGDNIQGNFIQLSYDIRPIFKKINVNEKVNKLSFIFQNKEFLEVIKSWDQSVQDEFEQYLPKSKKGKIRAWYLPEIEAEKIEEPVKIGLPKPHVVFNLENLTLEKAFEQLNKMVTYKDDPLWDGGYYGITHNKEGWTGYAGLYLYDSLESKEDKEQAEDKEQELNITDDIKKLFLFIQECYRKENPKVEYDSLFVTVQRNGKDYTQDFELDGEEVYPDAPPMPDELSDDYLLQNLANCLFANFSFPYEWAGYSIKREKNADGRTDISGDYFYSENEDKSELKPVTPGDEIYMMNITARLLDEFWDKEEQDWKEVVIWFSKNGKVYSQIYK
ncbi:hypothetical protein [Polluticaenibacter yanchengensis]|uniref:DUF1963 domain-containing protein n=1 Tax=Polluticaenibacter yanchengensis TaxID=3014562 RepID=A0ABT4UPV9_9BACT|nr:hypothetical protein [Chitinophagaceae bacterium LY-5]